MIDPLKSSEAAGAAGKAPGASSAPSSGSVSFAALHKAAVAKEATSAAAAKRKELVPASELKPPKGEKWEAVAGRNDYAEIVEGKRNGYFVNLKPGPRQGEEFLIVRRDGKRYHIYGEGRNREVIEVRDRIDPAKFKPREGEAWSDVQGHRDYKKIDGGGRDGLHVNLSGNERTGKAFRLERKGDRILHIYGEGENRRVVEVGWRRREAAETGKAESTGSPDAAKGE